LYSKILNLLVKKRGLATYGYVEGIDKNNFKEDAKNLKGDVEEILKDCESLLQTFSE